MPKYELYPGVDEGYNFPPEVRQSVAASTEIRATVANSVGEIVPGQVATAIAQDPTIKAAALAAVGPALAASNIVRAYPETAVTPSPLTEVPFQWVYKTLNDPYVNNYQANYEGTWVGTSPRQGRIPLLTAEGLLRATQIPGEFVTKTTLPGLLPPQVNYQLAIDSLTTSMNSKYSDLLGRAEKKIRTLLPIFGARVRSARFNSEPLAAVFVGSSTSAAKQGFVGQLTSSFQNAYPQDVKSIPQWSPLATFTRIETPGLHGYSAGLGGATAANYLTDAKCNQIASLLPGLMHHMVGSNDWSSKVAVATYKANIINRLNYLDSVLLNPCQHVLVHAYERMDVTSPVAPWSAYGQALKEIADSRSNTVFVDLSGAYIPNGVPGSDPLVLISPDKVHQTMMGYLFMADLLADTYLS